MGQKRYFHHALPPLPNQEYPRAIPEKQPTWGYYIAAVVVYSVWAITPLSL